jgi:peptide/nickel transport system permease protein
VNLSLTALLLRLTNALVLVWAVATALFVLVHLAPGDPAAALGGDWQSGATLADERARLGLDRSLIERYGAWLAGLVRGDLGWSALMRRPVAEAIAERLPLTLGLVLPALVLSSALGTGLALWCARRPGGIADRLTGAAVVLLFALPVYWVAHLLVFVFAVELGWLPVQGLRSARGPAAGTAAWLDVARHLALPLATLVSQQVALVWLVVRAGLVETRGQPHFRTALAKGLGLSAALRGHALPQVSLALVTVIGARFAGILTAATLVETVFGLPGMGRLLTAASLARDHALALGVFLCAVVLTLAANAVTDLLYARIDPRIRAEGP